MNKDVIKCLIIGAGPAGYTAAIYAARAQINPVLYQGAQPGGQLTITTDVENYPGYPDGVLGPKMMEDFLHQAKRFGTDIRSGSVTKVDFSKQPYEVVIDEKEHLSASTVVISTGASAKWLNLESEQRLNGAGVSACAVCDGFFFRGQDIALVGGGDTACEEAMYLSKLCNKVYMIVRRDVLRASKIMADRVQNTPNIEVLWNHETQEVLGENSVDGVRVLNNKTQVATDLKVTGFFVAIGHKPNTDLFKGILDMDDAGYLITKADSTKTNIPGIFACGDVQDKHFRQAVTAAGTGCMAALEAERYLAEVGLN